MIRLLASVFPTLGRIDLLDGELCGRTWARPCCSPLMWDPLPPGVRPLVAPLYCKSELDCPLHYFYPMGDLPGPQRLSVCKPIWL